MLTWALLLAAGLLTACSQDELADSIETSLPEGKYPLQIGSVSITADVDTQPWSAGAPQTRVRENDDRNSSRWNWNELIGVQIEGSTKSGIYYLYYDYSVTPITPVYWENTQAHKVRAWFPADGKVALDNQTTDLAYALYAETAEAVDYKAGEIFLPFAHALAKVRVVLEGDKKDDVTDVQIKTYTNCTLGKDGTLTASGTEDFIPMVETNYNGARCWEANVVPEHGITMVKVNNDKKITLSTSLTPLEAKVNTITLKAGDLTPADPITITINGNPTVTLDNMTISNDNIPIRITGGSSTLIIKGTTALTTTNMDAPGIQLEGENTNVQIKGNGRLEIKSWIGAGIGSGKGGTCGNIDIEGITATIDNSRSGATRHSAGIGGGECGHCGNITIKDANLTIQGVSEAAAIGCGSPYSYDVITTCGNIEIVNSDITATVIWNFNAYPAAIGCCGAYNDDAKGSCGDITITLKSDQDKEFFLSKLTLVNARGKKVGLGAYNYDLKGKVGTIT